MTRKLALRKYISFPGWAKILGSYLYRNLNLFDVASTLLDDPQILLYLSRPLWNNVEYRELRNPYRVNMDTWYIVVRSVFTKPASKHSKLW